MKKAIFKSFAEIVEHVTSFLAVPGRSQAEVSAELALATDNIDILAESIPDLYDPINVDKQAELASLHASLWQAATDYLTGSAPIVSFVTSTQTTTIDIANEQYQDPNRAEEIERLNVIPDPLNIPPGTELKIYGY